MKRFKTRRSKDRKIFARTARRVKKINLTGNVARGGVRL